VSRQHRYGSGRVAKLSVVTLLVELYYAFVVSVVEVSAFAPVVLGGVQRRHVRWAQRAFEQVSVLALGCRSRAGEIGVGVCVMNSQRPPHPGPQHRQAPARE
jgi:hypothetical protein